MDKPTMIKKDFAALSRLDPQILSNDSKTKPNFRYFKISEFDCPCCHKNKTSLDLIQLLDEARQIAGIPFNISSGYRCKKHNSKVGGSVTSSHLSGLGADIMVAVGYPRLLIIESLLKAGFQRIGVSSNMIHVDIDPNKPSSFWLYPAKRKLTQKKRVSNA